MSENRFKYLIGGQLHPTLGSAIAYGMQQGGEGKDHRMVVSTVLTASSVVDDLKNCPADMEAVKDFLIQTVQRHLASRLGAVINDGPSTYWAVDEAALLSAIVPRISYLILQTEEVVVSVHNAGHHGHEEGTQSAFQFSEEPPSATTAAPAPETAG
jgi:hypothetical protein